MASERQTQDLLRTTHLNEALQIFLQDVVDEEPVALSLVRMLAAGTIIVVGVDQADDDSPHELLFRAAEQTPKT